MKSIRLLFIYLPAILFWSCNSQQNRLVLDSSEPRAEQIKHLDENDLNQSQWVNQPMNEFPQCIDTLFLNEGFFRSYSCESESYKVGTYRVLNDTLFVQIKDFGGHESSVYKILKKSKYVLRSKGLVKVEEKRKSGANWYNTKPEFLNKHYYTKING